jgi:hypothetical protein
LICSNYSSGLIECTYEKEKYGFIFVFSPP